MLPAFAAAHGLRIDGAASAHEFKLVGGGFTMTQGSILHRSGGKLFHFRLSFEPYVCEPAWMLTPSGVTRWAGGAPAPAQRTDVPGHALWSTALDAFAAEVKTHWQLKLGEAGRLYLEALELVSPRAWELAWDVISPASSRTP